MTEELEQLLKNLKLRRMLEIYDEQLRAADQDDIFRLGDELQLRKPANLFAVHARLAGKRERLQRPALGQIGAPDTPLQRALLPGLKLRAHQARDELRVTDIVLVGGSQLFVIDLQHAPQLEILQQLF